MLQSVDKGGIARLLTPCLLKFILRFLLTVFQKGIVTLNHLLVTVKLIVTQDVVQFGADKTLFVKMVKGVIPSIAFPGLTVECHVMAVSVRLEALSLSCMGNVKGIEVGNAAVIGIAVTAGVFFALRGISDTHTHLCKQVEHGLDGIRPNGCLHLAVVR